MKPILDKQGRLFGKLSVIDLLVVAVVLVMAFALHVKNNRLEASKTTVDANSPIIFTALAENVPLHVAEAIQAGDKVFDKDRPSGGAIGVISGVEQLPGSKVMQLGDGSFVQAPNDNSRNLLVTVECSGSINEGRYSINRIYELGVNAARNFYTPYAAFTASVTQIH